MSRSLPALILMAATATAATVTHDIVYAKRGSLELKLDASVPDGAGPFPAVIIVHGGGFMRGNKVTYVPPMFPPLTKAQFAWFTIDYRLAPEFKLPTPVEDVVSAIEWVHSHAAEYKVDRRRIALLGESAGAFLVDYAAMVVPKQWPVAAVVSFYGPHDLLYQAKEMRLSDGAKAVTGVQELNAEGERRLRELSPYYMVRMGLPPFFLLHGTADEQVIYEQSPRFCQALQAQGVACELYTLPGARHGMGSWEQHEDQQGYKAVVVEWLKKTLTK